MIQKDIQTERQTKRHIIKQTNKPTKGHTEMKKQTNKKFYRFAENQIEIYSIQAYRIRMNNAVGKRPKTDKKGLSLTDKAQKIIGCGLIF